MSRADERFEELRSIIEAQQEDISKFYEKGNKAAGTRVRKGMQELKKKAQEIRVEIQDIKKNEL